MVNLLALACEYAADSATAEEARIREQAFMDGYTRAEKLHEEAEEVEIREITITVDNEDGDTVFKASGKVDRKTCHHFLENVGYAFVPRGPAVRLAPSRTTVPKISCGHPRDCTDYPKKCPDCGENKAKSYFKPKEEG